MSGALALAFLAFFAIAAESSEISLDRLWVPTSELRFGWDSVSEAPGEPVNDPDLVSWGVHAQGTRHYTRHQDGFVEVCSVEIWAFNSEPLAEAARAGIAYPSWVIAREGPLLLMLRGRSWRRGGTARPGVFAECRRIGDLIRQRAAQLLRD